MDEPQPLPSLAERLARGLPALGRYVRRRMGAELRERESASDIVQSTVREVLRSGRFDDRGDGGFQCWLRAAAENKLRNRARSWRAQRRAAGRPELVPEDAFADFDARRPSQDAALREESERLERALAALSAEHRLVVRRVHQDGASYAEVAAELGKSPEAVRKLLTRALGRLSTLLREG